MPMLYGEGERAFIRLQEEIMKHSADHSLFAWSSKKPCARGLLARSPADFAGCADIVMTRERWNRTPYTITNLGLSIRLPMLPWAMDTYLAVLDCERVGVPDSRIGIFLRLLPQADQLARVLFEGEDIYVFKEELAEKLTYRDVFVQQNLWGTALEPERFYGFYVRKLSAPLHTVKKTTSDVVPLSKVWSKCNWDDEKRLLELPVGESGTAGMISWARRDGNGWFMKFGFDKGFNPVLQLGGDLMSPNRPLAMDPNSPEAWMDPSWMDGPEHSKYLHKADRLTGLQEEVFIASMRISIEEGEMGETGKRGWIVDIEDHKSKYPSIKSTAPLPAASPAKDSTSERSATSQQRWWGRNERSPKKPEPFQLSHASLLSSMQHAQVLLLQLLEVVVELLVPRVQNEDLEAQRRGTNGEVGPGQNHIQGAGPDIEASLVSRIGDRTRGGPSPALGDVLTDILYSTYIPPRGNESTSINPTGKETKSVYYAKYLMATGQTRQSNDIMLNSDPSTEFSRYLVIVNLVIKEQTSNPLTDFLTWSEVIYPFQTLSAISIGIDSALYNGGYLVQAAAKFAKEVAQSYYTTQERVYGHTFGASGGFIITTGVIENSVGGELSGAFAQLSAVEPAEEATRFGYPLPTCEVPSVEGLFPSLNIEPILREADPSYKDDFWSLPGYVGTETEASILGEYMRAASIVKSTSIIVINRDDSGVAEVTLEGNEWLKEGV
ncbi:hypothetical protein V491_04120 [Pseudogymnoascus sp. VKM F-3775]|nr:hypothetical protein V491_04120 [Pseudogymnoascus sp. VKM F-3775]